MDTAPAKEAIKNLQLSFSESLPSEKMFLSVRDFLIVRLALENCQRPGPLENARLLDFNRAKEVEGRYVMRISKHKTSKSGPAPITISRNLMTNLRAYIDNVRPRFANKGVKHIFVTKNGVPFINATIGKRIKSWWSKATGQGITATQVRKMGSSEMIACVAAVLLAREGKINSGKAAIASGRAVRVWGEGV